MKKEIETGQAAVVCQRWLESELGWGDRPDGFSLHLTLDGLSRYVKQYWDSMPDTPPIEYSRPVGDPFMAAVTEAIRDQISEEGDGLRYYSDYATPESAPGV